MCLVTGKQLSVLRAFSLALLICFPSFGAAEETGDGNPVEEAVSEATESREQVPKAKRFRVSLRMGEIRRSDLRTALETLQAGESDSGEEQEFSELFVDLGDAKVIPTAEVDRLWEFLTEKDLLQTDQRVRRTLDVGETIIVAATHHTQPETTSLFSPRSSVEHQTELGAALRKATEDGIELTLFMHRGSEKVRWHLVTSREPIPDSVRVLQEDVHLLPTGSSAVIGLAESNPDAGGDTVLIMMVGLEGRPNKAARESDE